MGKYLFKVACFIPACKASFSKVFFQALKSSSANAENENAKTALPKIKVIDLSFNDIDMKELKNLKTLEKFIDNHHELKRLKLQYTEFFEGFILLVKLNDFKQEVNPIIKKLISREIKFVLEPNLNNIDYGLLNNILSYKDKAY